jgi:hypothetical protein
LNDHDQYDLIGPRHQVYAGNIGEEDIINMMVWMIMMIMEKALKDHFLKMCLSD